MIAMWLTTLLLVAPVKAAVAPLSLAVVAAPDVTDSLVARICTEARAIWGHAGIFALSRNGFELTSQRRAAADHSWIDMACHSGVSTVPSC